MSKIRHGLTDFDIQWLIFWQQMEACTAVIIVSLSAYPTVFVAHESRLRDNQQRHRQWYMSKKNQMTSALRRRRFRYWYETEEELRLGSIPRATMTGMSTFIRGGNHNSDDGQVFPLDVQNAQGIRVEHVISTSQG